MSVQELISSGANVSITVTSSDLLLFADRLVGEARKAWEEAQRKNDARVSPQEASGQLQVDKSTLWRWAKSGYLSPIEVGGKRFYRQSDIDKILAK